MCRGVREGLPRGSVEVFLGGDYGGRGSEGVQRGSGEVSLGGDYGGGGVEGVQRGSGGPSLRCDTGHLRLNSGRGDEQGPEEGVQEGSGGGHEGVCPRVWGRHAAGLGADVAPGVWV
eukprot:1195303-Prorocentrum_minimum.AAC.2